MRRWLPWVGVLLLAAGAAVAQPRLPVLEPSPALGCLTPPVAQRGEPEYPPSALRREQTGRVKVLLRFGGPELEPAVEVLEQEGDDSFVASVRRHVRAWRVPCQDRGAPPARLTIDFSFVLGEPVRTFAPEDADAAERERQLACLVHTSGRTSPDYPPAALKAEVRGRLIVLLHFTAPDQPPAVQVLHRHGGEETLRPRSGLRLLARPLHDWAEGYRLPCLQGGPLRTSIVFVYRIGDDGDYGFRPALPLLDLLPQVRNIRLQRLQFDFNKMGCPFELDFDYRQDSLPNRVAQRGSFNPARGAFIDWLRQSRLDLSERALDSVFASSTVLQVPCLKIDLNPKE